MIARRTSDTLNIGVMRRSSRANSARVRASGAGRSGTRAPDACSRRTASVSPANIAASSGVCPLASVSSRSAPSSMSRRTMWGRFCAITKWSGVRRRSKRDVRRSSAPRYALAMPRLFFTRPSSVTFATSACQVSVYPPRSQWPPRSSSPRAHEPQPTGGSNRSCLSSQYSRSSRHSSFAANVSRNLPASVTGSSIVCRLAHHSNRPSISVDDGFRVAELHARLRGGHPGPGVANRRAVDERCLTGVLVIGGVFREQHAGRVTVAVDPGAAIALQPLAALRCRDADRCPVLLSVRPVCRRSPDRNPRAAVPRDGRSRAPARAATCANSNEM